MTYEQWSSKADYLKKRYDYARHVGSAQTEAWRLNLLAHLEAEPDSDATPLPEITEPSTVEKFGDGWIDWAGGECPVLGGQLVEARFRDNSPTKRVFSCYLDWRDVGNHSIIAYRVVKD